MRCVTLLAVILTVASPALCAESVAQPPDPVVAQLELINATLERLTAALTETTRLDLIIRRLEIAATRVAASERRLLERRDEAASLTEAAEQQADQVRALRARLDSGGSRVPAERLEGLLADLDEEAGRLERRRAAVAAEIAELEARLAAEQREAADWQDYLDRRITDL